jgi:hypothetical protein
MAQRSRMKDFTAMRSRRPRMATTAGQDVSILSAWITPWRDLPCWRRARERAALFVAVWRLFSFLPL